jgi:hypothetical protein
MSISSPLHYPFRPIDQLKGLDPSFIELYSDSRELHDSITDLWNQFTINWAQGFKSHDLLDKIELKTAELKNNVNLLKDQLNQLSKGADPRISELAQTILSKEAVYLSDMTLASNLQKIEYEKALKSNNKVSTKSVEPSLKKQKTAINPLIPKEIKKGLELTEEEKIQVHDAFKQEVSQYYSIRNVYGDGNCCTRALALALNPDLTKEKDRSVENTISNSIRGYITEFMKTHPVVVDKAHGEIDFSSSCIADPRDPSKNVTYEDYLKIMAKPGVFLTYAELIAFAHSAKRPVWVFTYEGVEHKDGNLLPMKHYRFGDEYMSKDNPPIKLGHWGEHFDLLVDKT